jgi:2-polyprenyl-6-hydroxyphenyl methylase/3-demethylubiquinone-9 3-methyltransferase
MHSSPTESSTKSTPTSPSSVNPEEIAKFNALADQWWAPRGEFEMLHRMNPLRMQYIQEWTQLFVSSQGLQDRKVLDIGCGGGLLSESLTRRGAHVVGVDAAAQNIRIAESHAMRDPQLKARMEEGKLTYRYSTAGKEEGPKRFDSLTFNSLVQAEFFGIAAWD